MVLTPLRPGVQREEGHRGLPPCKPEPHTKSVEYRP
jgi:hypothetical protein